jgi:hypothetical protein
MVVLGGGAVSFERGTPVEQRVEAARVDNSSISGVRAVNRPAQNRPADVTPVACSGAAFEGWGFVARRSALQH